MSKVFQSTLPAWGATLKGGEAMSKYTLFQSTLPAWGATTTVYSKSEIDGISIHAPRMGSDYSNMFIAAISIHFNPRSPHGERLSFWTVYDVSRISIHAPRMGSDTQIFITIFTTSISIHAPRMGSDVIFTNHDTL